MIGALIPARIQGKVESILFARANSRAPALYGLVNSCRRTELLTCAPIWIAAAFDSPRGSRSCGDKSGEEKDSRYKAMKKISLRAQQTKRTT